MGLTLAQLTAPQTAAQVFADLVASFNGRGPVVKTVGTGTGACTIAGTPNGTYSGVLQIVASGELGAATAKYSTDGGATYSTTATVPGSGIVTIGTTGVTATLAAGPTGGGTSFVAGDTFTFALSATVFPSASWASGSIIRTEVEGFAAVGAEFSQLLANIANGGLVYTATGSWLDLLSVNVYGLTRTAAIATQVTVILTDSGNVGPFTIAAGQLWVASTGGLRFNNPTGGTLPKGTTAPGAATGALAGAGAGNLTNGAYTYKFTFVKGAGETAVGTVSNTVTVVNAAANGKIQLTAIPVSTEPGVTARKVYRTISGGSTYKLLTTLADNTTTTYLDNTADGSLGATGPATDSTLGTLALTFQAESPGAAYNVGDAAITTMATPLPGVTVSNTGPNSITVSGTDAESDTALQARCVNRWSALGIGATAAAYQLWAATAAPAVTKTLVQADASVAGQVDVYCAGTTGPASGADVTAVQTYINARAPLAMVTVVSAAAAHAITVTATVYVAAANLAAAQLACAANLAAYFASVPIGGTVYVSAIYEALMTPTGVRNATMTVPAADVVLSASEVATLTQNLTFTAV